MNNRIRLLLIAAAALLASLWVFSVPAVSLDAADSATSKTTYTADLSAQFSKQAADDEIPECENDEVLVEHENGALECCPFEWQWRIWRFKKIPQCPT